MKSDVCVRVGVCVHECGVCMRVHSRECVCMCVGECAGARSVWVCTCVQVHLCKGEGVHAPSAGRDRPYVSLGHRRGPLAERPPHDQDPEGAGLAPGTAWISGDVRGGSERCAG